MTRGVLLFGLASMTIDKPCHGQLLGNINIRTCPRMVPKHLLITIAVLALRANLPIIPGAPQAASKISYGDTPMLPAVHQQTGLHEVPGSGTHVTLSQPQQNHSNEADP
jgi:hypothetical protein